ncbi:MAG: hypothetical protein O2783_07925 [Chloroflexi bacterium]|nr:hypothetical protein [Chloroflexota bacterium]
MSQELGRVERPSWESFRGKRKLLLVPRVYEPPADADEVGDIIRRYWDQVQSQVASLESGLGPIKHIYHESLTDGGEQGLGYLETVDKRCHIFAQSKSQAGATFEATEDEEILVETIDLQRCLMLPFTSNTVATKLHEWFTDGIRRRYEHISKRIDETLGENEVGLLVINERHQVQFPADVEVFFVAPPALDEFRRWLDAWIAKQQVASTESAPAGEPADEPESV